METDRKKTLNNALCSILFKKNGFCCLCLETISAESATPSPVHIHDAVIVENSSNTEIYDIVSCVLGFEFLDSISTEVICDQCIRSAINSYRFIDMCKKNKLNLDNAIDCLAGSVEETILDVYDYKTLYLSVNTNAKISQQYYDTSSTRTRAGAFKKFKSLSRPKPTCQPKLEQKSKSGLGEINSSTSLKQLDICNVVSAEDGSKKFECKICSVICGRFAALESHFRTFHISQPFEDLQEVPFHEEGSKLNLKKDNICDVVTAEDSSRKYKCKVCSLTCSRLSALQRHFRTFHSSHPVAKQCEDPSIEDRPELNLKRDKICTVVTDKDGSKIYECKICYFVCPQLSGMQRHHRGFHISRQHKPGAQVCSQCGKSFKSPRNLRYHETHTHNLRLSCPKCKKIYRHKKNYIRHISQATCERISCKKSFQCDTCSAMFSLRNSLIQHMKVNHEPRRVLPTCAWCGKKFNSQSALKGHIVKHTQEKNFKCELCDGAFVTKASLLYHTRTHTGETPYQCKFCELSFLSASRRSEHVRKKHMEPSLECGLCPKKFRNYSCMRRHRKRHLNPSSSLYIFID